MRTKGRSQPPEGKNDFSYAMERCKTAGHHGIKEQLEVRNTTVSPDVHRIFLTEKCDNQSFLRKIDYNPLYLLNSISVAGIGGNWDGG